MFYDFRHEVFGDATLDTDIWVTIFDADLNYQREERMTQVPMAMRQAPLTGARG